jgi:hypothetical protein
MEREKTAALLAHTKRLSGARIALHLPEAPHRPSESMQDEHLLLLLLDCAAAGILRLAGFSTHGTIGID